MTRGRRIKGGLILTGVATAAMGMLGALPVGGQAFNGAGIDNTNSNFANSGNASAVGNAGGGATNSGGSVGPAGLIGLGVNLGSAVNSSNGTANALTGAASANNNSANTAVDQVGFAPAFPFRRVAPLPGGITVVQQGTGVANVPTVVTTSANRTFVSRRVGVVRRPFVVHRSFVVTPVVITPVVVGNQQQQQQQAPVQTVGFVGGGQQQQQQGPFGQQQQQQGPFGQQQQQQMSGFSPFFGFGGGQQQQQQ